MFTKAEGARLSLIGSFADLHDFFQGGKRYPAIYGYTTDGKKVTLVDCDEVQGRMGSGVPTQTLRGRFMVIGNHMADFEGSRFTDLSVRFSNLEDWLGQSGTSQNWPSAQEPYTLTYTRPILPRVRIPGGSVRFTFGFGGMGTMFREMSIREEAVLRVTKSEGFTFREASRGFIWTFQNLLTLFTMEPSDVIEVHVGKGADLLQLYYQSSVEAPERDSPLMRSDMLMDAHRLGRHLPAVIRHWLVASEELRSVLSLYFAVMSGRWMFLESRFLNVVQAAEVFHRHTYPNRVDSRVEHRRRIKAILEAAPDEYRDWLQGDLTSAMSLDWSIDFAMW